MDIIQPTSIFDLSQEIEEGGGGGGGGFLDSTTYASNGLENWLSLICTNIKLFLTTRPQDQNIQCLHTIKR